MDEEGIYHQYLLADTVGFIRKLPHTLVESFKSTLAVAQEADLLLHVVDVTHPEFEEHIQIVKNTLSEIGVIDKPTILVLNKIDAFPETEDETFADFENNWISNEQWPVVFVSAANKTNIETLKNMILSLTKNNHVLKSRF